MQHSPRINDVKRSKAARRRIEDRDDVRAPIALWAEFGEQLPRRADGILIEVNGPDRPSTEFERSQRMQPGTAADIEKGLSRHVTQQFPYTLNREVDTLLVDLAGVRLPVFSKLEMRSTFRQAHVDTRLGEAGLADDFTCSQTSY